MQNKKLDCSAQIKTVMLQYKDLTMIARKLQKYPESVDKEFKY